MTPGGAAVGIVGAGTGVAGPAGPVLDPLCAAPIICSFKRASRVRYAEPKAVA